MAYDEDKAALLAERDAACASLQYAEDWVQDLVDGYVGRRPASLAAGLDSLGELVRLGDWLHAEQRWRADRAEASRQAWAEEAMRLDVENEDLRDQLREEQIWRDDVMHEMSGLNPDRPIAKTARRYRRERDEAREEAERLKAGGCGCPTESDPDPEAPLLPCGHRTSRQVGSVPQCAVHAAGDERSGAAEIGFEQIPLFEIPQEKS